MSERPSQQLVNLLTVFRARRERRYDDVERVRREFEDFSRALAPRGGVRAHRLELGGVPAERVEPPATAAAAARQEPLVLYFHGGGYVSGSLATHRPLAARLAAEAAVPVVHVEYRRAPEHPFPAALDDARSVYRRLLDERDPRQLVVGGDSAGGGLALALAVAARDAGLPLPSGLFALSPWTDLAVTGASVDERAARDPLFDRRALETMAGLYRASAPADDPLVSPLYADLAGLPPTFLQVGTAEVLHDDSTRLAERLEAAGVAVELEVWDGAFHGWQLYAEMLPEGAAALAAVGRFVRARLGLAEPGAAAPTEPVAAGGAP